MDDLNISLSQNLTTKPLCKCKDRDPSKSVVQILFGGGAFFFNILIVIAVVRYKALRRRKEYIIVGGLALADSLEGFATLLAGIWRSWAILGGWHCTCLSKALCMAMPQSQLWKWTEFATAFMLLAISVDRCIAVFKPLSYYRYDRPYAFKMVGIVYLYALFNLCIAWIYPFIHRNELMSAYCSSGSTVAKLYYQYSKYTSSFGSMMSCVVFGAVVVKFYAYGRSKVANATSAPSRANEAQQKRQQKAQRQLTVTLGISSACTLLLDSIPRAYGIWIEFDNTVNILGPFKSFVFQLTKVNAMANFFIYALRQKEMKMALIGLFTCKDLPMDVNKWEQQSNSKAGGGTSVGPSRGASANPTLREKPDP